MPTIYMQGDEGREVVDKLCHVDVDPEDGYDHASLEECVEYLLQWDSGEGVFYDVNPVPNADNIDDLKGTKFEGKGLVLSFNFGLGYISLARTEEV